MKKAIANLSFSDLKVRYFTGRSILISDTGQGKRYQYRNGCMTALGDLEISEWREMITELIAYRSEQELQKQLYEWCAEHTPWLHGKSEITDYALECHAARLFDDPLWADYIPFNRKYRPNVLDSAELIWAKTACCGTTQQFTVPQYQKICGQNFFCRTCNEWTTLIHTKHNNIYKWYADEEEAKLWRPLLDKIIFEKETTNMSTNTTNPFYGKTVVATGKLENYTRDGIQMRLLELGAKPGSSVSKNTDYLIVGEKAGSKLAKAQQLGVKTLTEQEFENMLAE